MKMKLLLGIQLVLLIAVSAFAGKEGSGGRNGGVGVVIDAQGHIATIGSFPPVRVHSLEMNDIPGLSELQDAIDRLEIPNAIRSQLKLASLPSVERRYFAADANAISDKAKKAILDAYHHVLADEGVPPNLWPNKVVALTHGRDTLLLPEFFTSMVDEISQSSILFHEGLWVLFPPQGSVPTLGEYARVINTDISFERWYRGTDMLTVYDKLSRLFSNPSVAIRAYAAVDLASGIFDQVVAPDGSVPYEFFLGDSVSLGSEYSGGYLIARLKLNRDLLFAHLTRQLQLYPKSYLIQFLIKNSIEIGTEGGTSPSPYERVDGSEILKDCDSAAFGNSGFTVRAPFIPNEGDLKLYPTMGFASGWTAPVSAGGTGCKVMLRVFEQLTWWGNTQSSSVSLINLGNHL